MNPILTATRAASMILQSAQSCEIPPPDQIEILNLGGAAAQLAVYVKNLDDLTAWSRWLDQPINVGEKIMNSGRIHCSIDGEKFDHALRVICMFTPTQLAAVPA